MENRTRVALIDKAPNRTDYVRHFRNEFEFDHYHLCSEVKKKVLKRDVDIEIDMDAYDWIILVGSEALLFFTAERSITEHSGRLIDNKFLTSAFWVSFLLVISYGPLLDTFFPGRNLSELGFGVTSVCMNIIYI
mgnify:CR=1 FL=1